jgi:hypothetical protein
MTRVPATGDSASAASEARAGGDDLTSAVVVRGREVELRETREHGVAVAADDGAHAGLLRRGGLRHGAAADADEAHAVGG